MKLILALICVCLPIGGLAWLANMIGGNGGTIIFAIGVLGLFYIIHRLDNPQG